MDRVRPIFQVVAPFLGGNAKNAGLSPEDVGPHILPCSLLFAQSSHPKHTATTDRWLIVLNGFEVAVEQKYRNN